MDREASRVPELEAEVAQLRGENKMLQELVVELRDVVEQLRARVAELEAELSRHSGNSSKPPSSDTLAQRAAQKARREEWTSKRKGKGKRRRPGKQPGDPGRHLAQVADPDVVVPHRPLACRCCGRSLEGAPLVGQEMRQVFDLPVLRAVVTAHVAERRRCPCGEVTTGDFPGEATAPACWGPRLRALGTYLLVRQHLPVGRCAELLTDVVGAPVSTGFLAGLPAEAETGLGGFLQVLKGRLAAEEVLHVDETGARVSGLRRWFHVASTPALTLVELHEKRGWEATEAIGVLPAFSGVAVHDRLSCYWRYRFPHAVCNAHLLRDLAAVAELPEREGVPSQRPWSEAMAALLIDAKEMAEAARAKGRPALSRRQQRRIGDRFDTIVEAALSANPDPLLLGRQKRTPLERQSFNLAVAFRDHKDEILRFAIDLRVPWDNNQAERDLRMVKLQQKISGCFRTHEGARRFCAIRSYISTAAKHGVGAFEVLTSLFTGAAWTIPEAAPS